MRKPTFILLVLLLVLLPAGCATGLDPGLMRLNVKPLSDFVIEAQALQPDATLVTTLAEKAAEALGAEEREAANQAIAAVRKFFDVPVKAGQPNVLEDLAAGAKKAMENIEKAGGGQ